MRRGEARPRSLLLSSGSACSRHGVLAPALPPSPPPGLHSDPPSPWHFQGALCPYLQMSMTILPTPIPGFLSLTHVYPLNHTSTVPIIILKIWIICILIFMLFTEIFMLYIFLFICKPLKGRHFGCFIHCLLSASGIVHFHYFCGCWMKLFNGLLGCWQGYCLWY